MSSRPTASLRSWLETELYRGAPFAGHDPAERRAHMRAQHYWASLVDEDGLPRFDAFDPLLLDDMGTQSFLVDLAQRGRAPVVRRIGTALRRESGFDAEAMAMAAVPAGTLLGHLVCRIEEARARKLPLAIEGGYERPDGRKAVYRGVLLPLSRLGRDCDYVYGVLTWRELAFTLN